eukprot:9470095-Pyramimonas_sp.AAC.1
MPSRRRCCGTCLQSAGLEHISALLGDALRPTSPSSLCPSEPGKGLPWRSSEIPGPVGKGR